MSEQGRHAQALAAYFTGINGEDYASVAALFAPAGELIAPGTGARRGREAIAAYFAAALAPYPEHRDDATRIVAAGDTVTVEIHFTGRLGSGEPLEFDAVDVFDFDADGLIVRLSSWYDSHAVRSQLRRARGHGKRTGHTVVYQVYRKEGMSREEFADYWENVHGPIAARLPHVRRYTNYAVATATDAYEPAPDGFTVLEFADEEGFAAAMTSPEMAASGEDAANFTRHFGLFTVEAHPIV
jgi:uncharacterized protein (TIGR02118 family)